MYDHELDRFKSDIHLVQYAVERHGYVRDRRESSRACHVLRREASDDTIVVRKNASGHWTYFSVRDGRDNGTIIDFLQQRGTRSLGDVREELRRYLGTPRPEFVVPVEPRRARLETRPPLSVGEAFAEAARVNKSLYLNTRGLRPETLADPRFADTWRVGPRRNVLFAHRDASGAITGFEIKNRGFTGFATGGQKTAWQSTARPDDRALVITESAIDALSHHQLHPGEAKHTRYLSTAGAPSGRQWELLEVVMARLPAASTVVGAVDSDDAGHKLAAHLEERVRCHAHIAFRRDSPLPAKDWNEVLQRAERDYVRALPALRRIERDVWDRGR